VSDVSASKSLAAAEPLAFREAKSEDVPDLMRMMRKLALQEPAVPFDEREIAAAWTLFLSKPEAGRAWLLSSGGELAGYIILTLGFSFEFRGHDAFIDELYVEEKYRRRGL